MYKHILIGRYTFPIENDFTQLNEWATWFDKSMKSGALHVGRVTIKPRKPIKKGCGRMVRKLNRFRAQPVYVSTVFLSLDHNHWGGAPLLFETMIFGGFFDGFQARYTTYDEAEEGHAATMAMIKSLGGYCG